WVIILSSFFVNLFVANLVPRNETTFITGGLASIFIYMFFAGIFVIYQTFPFSLGFSIRRKDYMLGTAAMAILTCAVFSLMLLLLAYIEKGLDGWNVGMNFFYMPFLAQYSFIEIFAFYFVLMIWLYACGF